MVLSRVRLTVKYTAVKELHDEKSYTICDLCELCELNRSSYYKWLRRKKSTLELESEQILPWIGELYDQHNGILGYRRMAMFLNSEHKTRYNHKRIYRLMKLAGLKSVIRRKRPNYIRSTPQITAENILNRDFTAERSNQKWLTDVTEFKYGHSGQKAYLSAILDVKDRRIVSWVMGCSNNNQLVFDTFDAALADNPGVHPLFHSDRGVQYTSKAFKEKLDKAQMTQSMSRIGRCIDNGPMEGFWGILKCEMYYLRTFGSYEELYNAVAEYIDFYNHRRLQQKLGCLAPSDYHAVMLVA